jgi:hypothetical protein
VTGDIRWQQRFQNLECRVANALAAEAIASELDELPLPYRFDVVALATLESAQQLRAHIERVGIRVHPAE